MIMEKAIIAEHITKKYKLYHNNKERLLDLITPKSYGESFYALTDVSFEAEKGDVVGFVGINGSGKSTLSNIIAGIVPETSGSVQLNGEVSLIAVSAGLKNDLTGRDNIELKCLMLGFNKTEIKEIEPAIIEFSELGTFIDQPVKSYSSGMRSRLGFAISVNVDPNILIIDEALSVGDKAFAEKSLDKMREFKSQGKTMIFVSHSIKQMKQFCEKILWLEFGKVKEYGTAENVLPKYEEFLKRWKDMTKKERELYRDGTFDDPPELEEDLSVRYNHTYREKVTSRLGHIKSSADGYIFTQPNNANDKIAAKRYRHSVYYIKRKAVYNNELFYLLSNQPSAEDGVVGWIEAANVKTLKHTVIDQDSKTFYLTGDGQAFSHPWGGEKNCVYEDLTSYHNKEFVVDKTETIGKHTWYRGKLDGELVWIHRKFLEKANTGS